MNEVAAPPATGLISFYLASLPGGAIQRIAINLALELGGRGHRVDLVAPSIDAEVPDALPPCVRVVNLHAWSTRLPWLRSRRRRAVPASAWALARYLRAERPAVVYAGGSYPNLAVLWARSLARVPVRVVLSEHGPLSLACHNPRRHKRFLPALARHFYPQADAIICCSEGVADDLASFARLPRDRITAIFNPVVSPALMARVAEPLDHPWLQADQPPVVLGAGRLVAVKDFATLIHAFALVRAKQPARLIILGEGEQRPDLERLVARLGLQADVALPGFVANPLPYMRRASVFALSSTYEGFGNVLAEALACGCPVVATDCPSGPAEVLDHGAYGRLVPMGDPAAFSEAVGAALAAPRDRARLVARAQEFDTARIADHYLAVLLPGARGSGRGDAGVRLAGRA